MDTNGGFVLDTNGGSHTCRRQMLARSMIALEPGEEMAEEGSGPTTPLTSCDDSSVDQEKRQ